MRINADFAERVVVRPGDADWVPSPMPGVERRMLDRIGGEVARATSLVRYAPGSRFSAHTHGGGEEFLVLEGVFSDESGDYPAGHYVRNPIGSAHAPHTEGGCTIFVKLHQFDPGDTAHVVADTRAAAAFVPGPAPGVSVLALHAFGAERVALWRLDPGARLGPMVAVGGEEVLVLEGEMEDAQGRYPAGTWIRSPDGAEVPLRHSDGGALLFVKSGHLAGAALARFAA